VVGKGELRGEFSMRVQGFNEQAFSVSHRSVLCRIIGFPH